MARVCNRHPFLLSDSICGRCGAEFCRECLVHPRGRRLPLCVACAVIAGGANPGTKGLSARRIRALERARDAEQQATAPRPLPAIENPVPAGFAFQEDELPEEPAARPLTTPPEPGRGRRRNRDRSNRDRPPTVSKDGRDEMMSWLDSVYSTESTE
jgi:hypothetical protein